LNLLSQIEAELESYDEEDESSKWASSINDIEWVVREFHMRTCITSEMKHTLANVIERALDNISNDFSEMSDEEIQQEKELAEEFEGYMNEARDYEYTGYSDIYTKELEDRSAREQHMEDMYRDGYHRSPSTSNFGAGRMTQQSKPMNEDEKAQSMFQSLKSRG